MLASILPAACLMTVGLGCCLPPFLFALCLYSTIEEECVLADIKNVEVDTAEVQRRRYLRDRV